MDPVNLKFWIEKKKVFGKFFQIFAEKFFFTKVKPFLGEMKRKFKKKIINVNKPIEVLLIIWYEMILTDKKSTKINSL